MVPGVCGAQDKMAEALRKRIVEEDTNHNLNAAIQDYQSAVTEYDGARQAAATALFRMAECYRKQGNSSAAIAAYSRVVRDFADQTKLAEQSRNQLTETYKIPAAAGAGAVDADATEARRQYRGLLQQGIRAAQDELSLTEEMKASNYRPQADLANLRAEMAALDAGPAPKLPAAGTPAAASRARYRLALDAAVDDANRKVQGLREKFKRGTVAHIDVIDAQNKVLYARIKLAAVVAGLAQPPAPAH
jgi:hypothetical protein